MRPPSRVIRWTASISLIVAVLLMLSYAHDMTSDHPDAAEASTTSTTIGATMSAAYSAGFRTEAQLVAITSIAISESSLVTQARHWQPVYGYRPITDVLGVIGGPLVTSADGRQLHSDRGLWQVSSYHWHQYTDAQCDNAGVAARLAFIISNKGKDFMPWDSYRSGSAQTHYDQIAAGWPPIRPLVRTFLAAQPK